LQRSAPAPAIALIATSVAAAPVAQKSRSGSSVGLVIGCVAVLCVLMFGGGVLLAMNWSSLATIFPTQTRAPEAATSVNARPTESGAGGPTLDPGLLSGDHFTVQIGDEIKRDEPDLGAGFIESPGAKDIYTFTADPDTEIYIHVIEPPQTGDLITIILMDDLNSELLYSCLQCGDPGVVLLERGGRYTLIVGNEDPDGAGTGAYRIKLWELPPPQEFDTNIGDEVSKDSPGEGAGYIETPGVKDIYTFTAEAGQKVYFQVNQPPQTNDLITWILTDEVGSELFDTCLQCGDPGVIQLEYGGTYTLTVGNDSGAATGSYGFKLWDVPPPDEFDIEIGDTVAKDSPGPGAGYIESPGASDEYTFSAAAGQKVYFEVIKPPDSYDLITWHLYDDIGNELFNTCLQCGDPGEFTLERGGYYTLVIGNDSGAGIGSYQFTLYVP